MKTTYLLPHSWKTVGWIILIPSIIFGFWMLANDVRPDFLDVQVFAFVADELMAEDVLFDWYEDNILNEIMALLVLAGGLMVAFSKQKMEDELISRIRLDALVWATYTNYAILALGLIFVYSLAFLWVMIFNMFTILFIFIIRFNYLLHRLKAAQS